MKNKQKKQSLMLAITAWAADNCEVYMIAGCWCVEVKNNEALYIYIYIYFCNFLHFYRVGKGVLRIN